MKSIAPIRERPGWVPAKASTRLLQRKCACGQHSIAGGECTECRKKHEGTLHRRAINQTEPASVPPIVHEVLRSSGQPLEADTRAFMESRFGHDFSHVRVHADANAAESARAVNALAYTVGRNVVFGARQYAPGTAGGKRLLAHELTHTVQQSAGMHGLPVTLKTTNPGDAAEKEADTSAKAILQEQSFSPRVGQTVQIARQEEAQAGSQCTPAPGIPPTNCGAYAANAWWLPIAYVNNATCACTTTPDSPTANCVRKFLQDRLAATPGWLKTLAVSQKPMDIPGGPTYPGYQAFVQTFLTSRIYQDHKDAYRTCCCPSGPAPYLSWIGVTTVPVPSCSLVGWTIRQFGSCHGTPGAW